MTPVYRQCRVCRTELPATREFFPVAKGCIYGLRSVCRDCHNAYVRGFYRVNLSSQRHA